jgi:hypothetical protein
LKHYWFLYIKQIKIVRDIKRFPHISHSPDIKVSKECMCVKRKFNQYFILTSHTKIYFSKFILLPFGLLIFLTQYSITFMMILRVYLIHYCCHDYPAFEYISIKYILFCSKHIKREGDTNTYLICLYIWKLASQINPSILLSEALAAYNIYCILESIFAKKNFLCSHSLPIQRLKWKI